jgi:hypothetical protein
MRSTPIHDPFLAVGKEKEKGRRKTERKRRDHLFNLTDGGKRSLICSPLSLQRSLGRTKKLEV